MSRGVGRSARLGGRGRSREVRDRAEHTKMGIGLYFYGVQGAKPPEVMSFSTQTSEKYTNFFQRFCKRKNEEKSKKKINCEFFGLCFFPGFSAKCWRELR